MTVVFSARRRAEEFAVALDASGPSATSARAPQPAVRREVAELVEVVTRLQAHVPVVPRPEFTADLRSRLMAEAQATLGERAAQARQLVLPPRPRGRRERRLVAAACAFVLVGGTAGMAAAAQSALPGQALYPVKRGLEHARAGLAFSQAAKGHDLLGQADDRLAEVRGLLAAGSPESSAALPATVDDFTSAARQGAALLMASYRDTGDESDVVSVRRFAARHLDAVRRLATGAPAPAQAALSQAAVALGAIDSSAHALCPDCAPDLPPLAVPRLLLTAAQVRQALRAAAADHLDNSHPVVVPRGAVATAPAGKATPAAPPRHRAHGQDGGSTGSDAAPGTGVSLPPAPDATSGAQAPSAGLPSLPLIGELTGGGDGLLNDPEPSTAPTGEPSPTSLSGLETLLPDPLDGTELPDLPLP